MFVCVYVYIYVCVCMYVCMHVCMYVCTHIHKHTHTHTHSTVQSRTTVLYSLNLQYWFFIFIDLFYYLFLLPGGFGVRGIEGKVEAVRYARENKIPFLGICLGMQAAVIEYTRTFLNRPNANSVEFEKENVGEGK